MGRRRRRSQFGHGSGPLEQANNSRTATESMDTFTLGVVVDTNDPDQMGRIRALCAAWGEKEAQEVEGMDWIIPVSPLAGFTSFGDRGAEQLPNSGGVAYGMWNVPKIGTTVLVGCLDGVRSKKFYIGGIHPNLITPTMPHGRYLWKQDTDSGRPDGPLDVRDKPIQPLYNNQTEQFTPPTGGGRYPEQDMPTEARKDNMEYQTRGADMQVGATNNTHIEDTRNNPGSTVADHAPGEFIEFTQADGTTRTIRGPGYSVSQLEPEFQSPLTNNVNYDSHTYSWTTPGFHSFSMNDRHDNCRIRVRTTSGHQIIMDDSNERIYISTAEGNTWIELDKVGNIDIFASKSISTHAQGDINFFSDKSIRLQAVEGIHMRADKEIRAHALEDISILSEQNIRTRAAQEIRIESDAAMHIQVGATLHISSIGRFNQTSGEYIVGDAQQIHWNSALATAADPAEEIQANWTSRVPEHEPWPRLFMNEADSDATATDKVNLHKVEALTYKDATIGRGGRGETYNRNQYWNR